MTPRCHNRPPRPVTYRANAGYSAETADCMREQLRLAAEEIIRLRGLLPRPGEIIPVYCPPQPTPWPTVLLSATAGALAAWVLL